MGDISLAPVDPGLGYWPMTPLVSFATFVQPKTAIAPGTVLDTVSLSAAAQKYISTAASAFPVRPESLTRLATGNPMMLGAGDYSGAAFIGQNLQNAIFENALLVSANFSNANLQGSKFISSVVTRANFAQANLRGADLRGAQGLRFAQVQSAIFDNATLFPSTIGADIFGTFGASGGK